MKQLAYQAARRATAISAMVLAVLACTRGDADTREPGRANDRVAQPAAPSLDHDPSASPATGPRVLLEGRPAEAEVLLWGASTLRDGEPSVRLRSDSDGSVSLAHLPPDVEWIGAFAAGATWTIAAWPADADPAAVFLHLGSCEPPLTLQVVGPTGSPIAGARLIEERASGLLLGTTGADGRASLCPPPATHIGVRADGYAFQSGVWTSGTIRLEPERTAEGVAVDSRGEPVAGAAIFASSWRGAPSHTHTDAGGRFTLRGLSRDHYRVYAIRPFPPGRQYADEHELALEDGPPPPFTVHFQDVALQDIALRDAEGPLRNEPFTVWGPGLTYLWEGRTDGEGRALAPIGHVSAPRRQSAAPIEGTPVQFELRRLTSVAGLVTYRGQPLAGVRLFLEGEGYGSSAQTDANGRYLADAFRPGPARISAEHHQLGVAAFANLEVVPDVFTTLDLELDAGASVAGLVVDRTGAALPLVTVRLLDPARPAWDQDPWLFRAVDTTNDSGEFRIVGIPGGGPPLTLQVLPLNGDLGAEPMALVGQPPSIRLEGPDAAVVGVRVTVDVERLVVTP